MRLIKLDATTSTNDFLRALAADGGVENYTVVTAREQTQGKGQMGSKWTSEAGKNLIMSILILNVLQDVEQIFSLNVAVALSVAEVLRNNSISDVTIKWPNDIMAGKKKVCGILIENIFKGEGAFQSIIGIGLNVNQTAFEDLPHASSLKVVNGSDFDCESLLWEIVNQLQVNMGLIPGRANDLWTAYNQQLFRAAVPMAFEDTEGKRFMGIIKAVNRNGLLEVRLEDDTIATFGIKEIQMLY